MSPTIMVIKIYKYAERVSKEIAMIIALSLDLDVGFFDKPEMLGEPLVTLKLLHYEGKISDPARGIYGCGAHSDFGLINLLATDDVADLQVSPNNVFCVHEPEIQRYASGPDSYHGQEMRK
ncbi:hypothetical protein MA16_Dca025713 [Dendrobium catenatum]|uniref:Uncharacterized protein n=1 Tax=Dendrobium catenatum TaxID=906689 RepID=A0A2I0VTP2_9ASPA|nr:hypothetical protein MA16_Dca025713 [Dendrobium catenatum]